MPVRLPYEEIRKLAVVGGRAYWQEFIREDRNPLLDECLNFNRAWMFFRNPQIAIPMEQGLRKCAIVVSDRGEVRYTADFYPDMNKCRSYLITMSEYFDRIDR